MGVTLSAVAQPANSQEGGMPYLNPLTSPKQWRLQAPGCEGKFSWVSAPRERTLIFEQMAFSTRKDFLEQMEELGLKGQKVLKESMVNVIVPIFRGGTTEYSLFELLVQREHSGQSNTYDPPCGILLLVRKRVRGSDPSKLTRFPEN